MTSQPLETIPEEPTPTPAPARVTADPPKTKPAKNPGRVASGKRLAEYNRLAREAKKKAEAESANPAATTAEASSIDVTTTTANDNNSSGLSLGAMLGIGGLIVSAAGLYYQREASIAAGTTKTRRTGTVSHSGKRYQENGIIQNTVYTSTMADFARSVLAGVAVGVFAAAVVKVNLFVIDKLVTINALALETAVVMGMSTLETIKMRRQIAEEQDEAKRWELIRKKVQKRES